MIGNYAALLYICMKKSTHRGFRGPSNFCCHALYFTRTSFFRRRIDRAALDGKDSVTTAAALRIIFRTLRPSRCTVFLRNTYSLFFRYRFQLKESKSCRSFDNSSAGYAQRIFPFHRIWSKIQRLPPQCLASSSEPFRPYAALSHCSSRLFFISFLHIDLFFSFSNS